MLSEIGQKRINAARKRMFSPKDSFSIRGFLIKPGDKHYNNCHRLAGKSNTLRNAVLRELFAYHGKYGSYDISDRRAERFGLPMETVATKNKKSKRISYEGKNIYDSGVIFHLMKNDPAYRCGENTKVMTHIIRTAAREVKAYEAALSCYHALMEKERKYKFKAEPQPPKFRSEEGKYVVPFTTAAISRKRKAGMLTLASTGITVPDDMPRENIAEVKIVPARYGYEIFVVYKRAGFVSPDLSASHVKYAGIDLGVALLAMIACNDPLVRAAMIGAGYATYIVRQGNYHISKAVSRLPEGVKSSRAIQRLQQNNHNRMKSLMHLVSKRIIQWCLENEVGALVVGDNRGWKQGVNIGRNNNRRFCKIPFAMLRDMLAYKAEKVGIVYLEQNESYTSKTSFLDEEDISKHDAYVGKRVMRSMFQSKDGINIHADQNGALNIMRKALGNNVFSRNKKLYARYPHNIPLQAQAA